MKKLLALIAILAVLLVSTVMAVGQVDISAVSSASGNPMQTVSVLVSVTNTLTNTTIQQVSVTPSALTLGSNSIPAPATQTISNLVNGTVQQLTFSLAIPENAPAGTYSGTIKAEEVGNPPNTDSFSYSVVVNQMGVMTVVGSSEVLLAGSPGDNPEKRFTLKNSGNMKLTNINISHDISGLQDDDNDVEVEFEPTTISSLEIGSTYEVTVSADISSGTEIETFSGNLKLKATELANYITIPFKIKVQPATCENGIVGDMDVTIDEPDSGDDFSPGAEIPVKVVVKNRADDDKKFIVEAYLYNVDENEEIDSYESSSKSIDEDKDGVFEFKLVMDDDTSNDNDEYKIFVKAYERDEEDTLCDQREMGVNKEVPEDYIVIKSFSISPISATCGDTVDALIQVKNAGSDDQDNLKIRLESAYLKVSQESSPFSLESSDSESTNTQYVRASFTIPAGTKDGSYTVKASTVYDGLNDYKELPLTVIGCNAPVQPTQPQVQPVQPVQPTQPTQPTENVNYNSKDLFDIFNEKSTVPSTFWLLADALLFIGIIAVLVAIFRPKH